MALRCSSRAMEAPVYDNAEVDLITIQMHHGGALLRSPNTRYLGGGFDYFDYVDGKSLSKDVLRQFVSQCRPLCDKDRIKFYHKFRDEWDKGFRLLSKDTDVLGFLGIKDE
ncbi:hypothetical protein LIER_19530 [Lithospermum erythrorhizon]|uniref:PB1-like domain-containing protein n=1 Tax=Lithospermum erythrorhizon TaxID=34254 RepID=A0AAV3QI49_LITER